MNTYVVADAENRMLLSSRNGAALTYDRLERLCSTAGTMLYILGIGRTYIFYVNTPNVGLDR